MNRMIYFRFSIIYTKLLGFETISIYYHLQVYRLDRIIGTYADESVSI